MASTPKAQALGVALRRAREDRGLTTRELADRVRRNHGEISRWETGDRAPKPEHVAQVLTVLGIVGKPYDEIMSLVHDPAAPMWVATSLPAQKQQLAAYLEMERQAVVVNEVSPMLVPGMLQTREYAHAIMSGGGLSPDEAMRRCDIRMARRAALTRPDPIHFNAFIGELALYQTIGDRSIVADQFRFLLEMARRPNVTVRITLADSGWYPALEGAFVFLVPANLRPIVQIELRTTSMFLHEEDAVADYGRALDMIDRMALAPEASTQLITARMEKLC